MIHPARYTSLAEILEDAFFQYPADLAAIEADRDRENARLTFGDFRREALRVQAWLAGAGLQAGARVAVLAENQAAWLLVATATLRMGGVLVPLDRRLTADEHRALLAHARVDALFADGPVAEALGDLGVPTLVAGPIPPPWATPWEALPPAPAQPPPVAAAARSDVCAIVYSSGTGGTPKGCQLTHGNYLAQYQALMETFDWRRGDRYLSILPTNHAIDFMCGFIASFCTGTTVIWQRTLRPDTLLSTMRKYRVTQMSVVPMVLKALEEKLRARLDELTPDRRRWFDGLRALNLGLTRKAPSQRLSSWLLKPVHDAFGGHLRMLYCGGAFVERERVAFFYELGLPVAIGYGLTEATTVLTLNDLRPFRGDTVGAPVPGVELRVVDAGPDGVGEVQVRGPTIFAGYLDAPELTAEAFDGDWLRTGDLGWIDGAHHLRLVGRRKNLVVTAGGKNVYPEDVEAAFASLDAEELCVLAEDYVWPRRGLTDERLILAVRPKAGCDHLALRDAIARLNRALPDFKRVAAALWTDEPFPRTASLKIKRHALADALRERHDRSDLQEVRA
jgi:long-chain acyl-CoA synthetase